MTKKSRSFAHSVVWNLAGAGLPLAFAFFAIPSLLAGYGNERFGLLTIAWALIGYFSIFDFGIGRALTKIVSDRLGSGNGSDVPSITRTALTTMFALGALACLALQLATPTLTQHFQLEPGLQQECALSLRILAVGIPFAIVSAGLIGLLEARSQFHSINQIRLAMGLLSFSAPLLMLKWSPSLVPATAALVISRAITTGFYFASVTRSGAANSWSGQFHIAHLNELLGFGGWITLSNLISPLMAQLDKVVIGAAVAIHILPFYSIPGDLINRLSFVPVAIIGVFFPAFATHWSAGNRDGVLSLYRDAGSVMFATALPLVLTIHLLAPDALTLWMGQEFSEHSTGMMRWLCIGLLANALARIPHALLQAIGRPSTTAKVHLLELPVYGVALWLLLDRFGILGAAIAWTGRMILDLALLSLCAGTAVPEIRHRVVLMLTLTVSGIAIVSASALIPSLWTRLGLCAAAFVVGVYHAIPILVRSRHDK